MSLAKANRITALNGTAPEIPVNDLAQNYEGTTVEEVLAEIGDRLGQSGEAAQALADDLASSAATKGASLVTTEDGESLESVSRGAKVLAGYTALRAYTGKATVVRLTAAGIAGMFVLDTADTTTADNGGTVIVAGTKRFKRRFDGAVQVSWFGAVGDGVTDDTAEIQAAASFANLVDAPLTFSPGIYYSNVAVSIPLYVSLNAEGAVFKFGPNRGSVNIFSVLSRNAEEIITVNQSELVKFGTRISALDGKVNGWVFIESTIPFVKRFTSDVSFLNKREPAYTFKGGVLASPLKHDYTTGGTVTVTFRKDDDVPLEIVGGGVDVNGVSGNPSVAGPVFCIVRRSNVKIKNWTIQDSANSPEIDRALLFRVLDSANVTFEDFFGDAMQQRVDATFSYLFNAEDSFNVKWQNILCNGGWGAFQEQSCVLTSISDSIIDRFDGHYNCFDMAVNNCDLDLALQVGSGGGYMRITDSRKIVRSSIPYVEGGTFTTSIVAMRGDYGGIFEGNVLIDGVKVSIADNFPAGPINGFRSPTGGDFGSMSPVNLATTITVRNVSIEASDALLSNPALVFNGVNYSSGVYINGTEPGTLLPTDIVVDNVKFSKQLSGATVVPIQMSFSSPNPIALGEKNSQLEYAQGGNARGINATDFQRSRTLATSVAEGNNSGILCGTNNRARNNNSVVTGGNDNLSGSATTSGAFVGAGSSNSATGSNSAVVSGTSNSTGQLGGFVGAGTNNNASGQYSFIVGGRYADAKSRYASWASSANTGTAGRQQYSGMNLIATTTNDVLSRLVASGNGTVATEQFTVASGSVLNFRAMVTGRDTGNNDVKAWVITGVIKNTAGTTSLVGTPVVTEVAADVGAATWMVEATADNTLDCLAISVTGAAGRTIRWHSVVEASEVA